MDLVNFNVCHQKHFEDVRPSKTKGEAEEAGLVLVANVTT